MTTRLLFVLALASLLALPVSAHAQARSSSGMGLTGLIGFESGDLDGVQFRGDLDFPLTRLTPRVDLGGVGTISYARLSHDVNSWEFVGAARFKVGATPRLDVYGDLGLGLYHVSAEGGGSDTGATMRLGAGINFDIDRSWKLAAELALHPHWGDYDESTFTFLGGVRYAF
jgi:opacity protein-like surface antigen